MINIQDIMPFLKKGWVAMDSNGAWYWHRKKPVKEPTPWNYWNGIGSEYNLDMFDIAPADDWEKSLIQVKGVKTR